ncbi:MBOAT family protein [Crocinitomicaceae bacterium]|jgi:D-alanyl-lipoteichoic acid acyltransferase DltB (MBOAT superfamily)|nr:MBOAT family protein [Crocinitomicaceae bacterium]MDB4648732.1 MBOAT family protein [Crocinitomicaceae bacterium]
MERLIQLFSFDEAQPLIFTQLDFWIFFLIVLSIFSFIQKHKLTRSIFLFVVSLFFYFKTSGLLVLLLSASIILNYFIGRGLGKASSKVYKKVFVTLSVLFNLLTLGYFKYAYFFTDSFNEMFHTKYEVFNIFARMANSFMGAGSFADNIVLPVGVSFFTFQSISYVVDIYRKEVQPVQNFFDYAFFVSFFPQLVAGPIVRARDFIPQIRKPFQLNHNEFSWAIIQIVKGILKKVVLADYIAIHFIDKVVDAPEAFPGFISILAMWGYSLQIYGDFSGYTDIAIGVSRLMGFKLLENFNSPYKAINVADFWRRWHKSLGSWLRDYLYIPLGGNRGGGIGTYIATLVILIFLVFITQWYWLIFIYLGLMLLYIVFSLLFVNFKKYIHRDLNLLITMVLGGLWHGASENFVIWGAMNGIALILYNHWKKISPYEQLNNWVVHIWKIFITFNFITFTRIWFRLEKDGAPSQMLHQIWHNFELNQDSISILLDGFDIALIVMLIGYIIHWLPGKTKLFGEKLFTKLPMYVQSIVVAIILVFVYQAFSDTFKPFVYFQF